MKFQFINITEHSTKFEKGVQNPSLPDGLYPGVGCFGTAELAGGGPPVGQRLCEHLATRLRTNRQYVSTHRLNRNKNGIKVKKQEERKKISKRQNRIVFRCVDLIKYCNTGGLEHEQEFHKTMHDHYGLLHRINIAT